MEIASPYRFRYLWRTTLEGNWRAEHLFALKQALGAFDFVGTQLTECDIEIEKQLTALHTHDGNPAKGKQRGRARNAPKFDLRTQWFKMCGVDLTRIDGIDDDNATVSPDVAAALAVACDGFARAPSARPQGIVPGRGACSVQA